MPKAKPKHRRTPRRPCRFPGITRDAEALNVHRVHLFLVLSGARQSPDLVSRYTKHLRAAKRPLPQGLAA
jgi:hypothetical protein